MLIISPVHYILLYPGCSLSVNYNYMCDLCLLLPKVNIWVMLFKKSLKKSVSTQLLKCVITYRRGAMPPGVCWISDYKLSENLPFSVTS